MVLSYKDSIDPGDALEMRPFNTKCIYCGNALHFKYIEKFTDYGFKDLKESFDKNEIVLKELQPDAEPCDYEELLKRELDDEYYNSLSENNCWYENTELGRCLACGWWKIIEEYNAVTDNIFQIFFEIVGAITCFELSDISVPLTEVRSYLIRKYNDRFNVHPRLFQDTVSSVFKDLGYDTINTGYTNDGGIDAILLNKGKPIAVQVKRTKNSIKVEQIRAFLGALTINSFNKGIYVSTGPYQSGCSDIANNYNIELINGQKFYDFLKDAQIIRYSEDSVIDFGGIKKLYYQGRYPMNSL